MFGILKMRSLGLRWFAQGAAGGDGGAGSGEVETVPLDKYNQVLQERNQLATERDQATAAIGRHILTTALGKTKVAPAHVDQVVKLLEAQVRVELVKGKPLVKLFTESGVQSPLEIDDWLNNFVHDNPHFLQAGAGGASSSSANGDALPAGLTRKHLDSHPEELAKFLKKFGKAGYFKLPYDGSSRATQKYLNAHPNELADFIKNNGGGSAGKEAFFKLPLE